MQQAELAGYETHNAWVSKAMQLYNLSQTYSTLIVAGRQHTPSLPLSFCLPLSLSV